jgi:chromosome partitioning protein
MDPVDPKRRGRRLFGGRRRHEHAAEAEMDEPTTTAPPDAPAPGGPPELAPTLGRADLARPAAVETVAEPMTPTSPADEADDDPVVVEDEPTIVPETDSTSDADPNSVITALDPLGDTPGPAEGPDDAAAAATPDPVPAPAVAIEPTMPMAAATPATEPEAPATTSAAGAVEGSDATDTTESGAAPIAGRSDIEGEDAGDIEGATGAEDGDDDGPEPYDLPRIMAIANQKGGVGKTTTSVNLGASLAELGYRVLVVDLDPQGNATTGLGVNAREVGGSIYDVIMNDIPVEDCVEPTSLKNLFVAPATIDLAGAEIELVPAFSRELKLRRALHEIRDDYDYVLIDCPPSLGLLTVNGLAAADDVIVPIQCEYYALEGLSQLIRNVSLVQKNLNPSLAVRGIVLTMYDARTKLADQVEQEVRNHFDRTVYQTVIPRTVRLSEAPSFGQPIILFDPTSRGAVAYRELAKEVSSGATRRTG